MPCNRRVEVEEDEVVTIQCEKDGLPNPTVEWMKVEEHAEDEINLNATHHEDKIVKIRDDLVKVSQLSCKSITKFHFLVIFAHHHTLQRFPNLTLYLKELVHLSLYCKY